MTDKGSAGGSEGEFDAWKPGLESSIPSRLLPLSTMFRPENVETDLATARELGDFFGLEPRETVVFRPERLIVHELLIRVTADLSVPDGPDYEELGINLRQMTARIYENHVAPRLEALKQSHGQLTDRAIQFLRAELNEADGPQAPASGSAGKTGLFGRLFAARTGPKTRTHPAEDQIQNDVGQALARWADLQDPFEAACGKALKAVTEAAMGRRGRLPADKGILVEQAARFFVNDFGSAQLGSALDPIIAEAAEAEGYRFLPAQSEPMVMNVKGASASGKSTIRPHQRALALQLGVPWEDFALVSPDYWRKFLLDYDSLGADHKYAAMLTGHELEIIDRKLDRYMAEKAERGTMPHLLIDRFRFDSFRAGADQYRGSNLLTRFGHTVFMFFMVTPPEATVERAWKRGLTTGRFKAVDDLLDHNIEAYMGMPELFFAWALSGKPVHYEFLDNNVVEGARPATIAAGWNSRMTVFDIGAMLDIERFKKIDIDAASPDGVYREGSQETSKNLEFVQLCIKRLERLTFVEADTGEPCAIVENGNWIWRSLSSSETAKETGRVLEMTGLAPPVADANPGQEAKDDAGGDPPLGSAMDYLVGEIRSGSNGLEARSQ